MQDQTITVDGVKVPRFFYGTAWKEEATAGLVRLAIGQGFRGIDTANQRRHYHEAGVGEGVKQAIAEGLVGRDDLFLQTKFTYRRGQDHRLPYDEGAPVATQVLQSFASSLEHLGVDRLDSLVLHGPATGVGLAPADREVWAAMEGLVATGGVRLLGLSNVSLEQLVAFHKEAKVKPRFVQNRCYAERGWDKPIRDFCAANGIHYQGFSLLTANQKILAHPEMARIAKHYGRAISQIVFRFALDVGMIPLTGTKDSQHMGLDLSVFDFTLDPKDVRLIEGLATGGPS
jgi:diketogulonate reductase-like aldo/keto reductase